MDNFLYAYLKNPEERNLREAIKERYNNLFRLTNYGEIPIRFKIVDDKIIYDDELAKSCDMNLVKTRKKYVIKTKNKINKQYLLPI